MIPAQPGHVVRDHGRMRTVLAWSDDGEPMAIYAGRLVPCDGAVIEDEGDEPENTNQFNSLIPADGWRARYQARNGTFFDEPLVAWGLSRDGIVVPVVNDPDGIMYMCPLGAENFVCTFHESDRKRVGALYTEEEQ